MDDIYMVVGNLSFDDFFLQELKNYRNLLVCVGCEIVIFFEMVKKMKVLIFGD